MLLLVLAGACSGPHDVVIGGDYRRVHDPLVTPVTKLDVLFVIDGSGSMLPEQTALVASAGDQLFGQLANELGGPPDLHVAVISTDVSTGRTDVPGCPAEDDDGRFVLGRPESVCPVTGTYLIDEDDGAGGRTVNYTGTLADAFSCAASIGSDGCGFEQPLEAVRRALDGRHPGNAGFLRPDALLLVVLMTDEDDCSTFDTTMFGEPQADLASPLGPRSSFRCFEFGVVCDDDAPRVHGEKTGCVAREDSPYVHGIDAYATFLRGLKADPATVMLAGMYGPVGPVVVGPDPVSPETYLALQYTCSAPETDVAAQPPVRLAQLADEFPSRFVFESLCDSAMSQRLFRISRSAAGVMTQRPCLLGNLGTTTTTERCRAFDVIGSAETEIRRCSSTVRTACFDVAPSAACDYTPSGLTATYRGTLADGHRLVVECLTAAE
jgi:hypothetical protein